ncbi:M23 family metallopeptidase [Clostridium guangxiense]|uniref:M23 family metallopeptidase n=1 Tax=Clostridium guangxiense TaxID=1662055 RepID=UPI001E4406A3|nr:M23 family metallopeptidase [Clostridium guangxiense]
MGSFSSQYEDYYNNMLKRRKYDSFSSNGYNRKDLTKKLINTLKFQIVGTIILFLAVFAMREVSMPETKNTYEYCKYLLNENYDYGALIKQVETVNLNDVQNYVNQINFDNIEAKSVDYIENFKSKITGEETVDEKIESKYVVPVNGKIIRSFGGKNDHKGIDIAASEGSNVKAVYNGTVELVSQNSEIGKYVVIDNGDGVESKYGNLNSISVKKGDGVTKGDYVGKVGKEAEKEPSHLHFEIMYMGENKNPESYFNINTSAQN